MQVHSTHKYDSEKKQQCQSKSYEAVEVHVGRSGVGWTGCLLRSFNVCEADAHSPTDDIEKSPHTESGRRAFRVDGRQRYGMLH